MFLFVESATDIKNARTLDTQIHRAGATSHESEDDGCTEHAIVINAYYQCCDVLEHLHKPCCQQTKVTNEARRWQTNCVFTSQALAVEEANETLVAVACNDEAVRSGNEATFIIKALYRLSPSLPIGH